MLDLVGKRFGMLTVTKRTEEKTKYGSYKWECVCDCGNTTIAPGSYLISGHKKSCGCNRYARDGKQNEYDISGEYGIGYCSKNHYPFYFDKEDFVKIKNHCWHENNGYVFTMMNFGSVRKAVPLHRFLLGITDPAIYIDHINCNKNDDRKNNLRICTPSQNIINRKPRKDNKIGYAGVSKHGNRYQARISKDGKRYYIGSFGTLEEAYAARRKVEQEMYGEFAYKGDVDIAQQ